MAERVVRWAVVLLLSVVLVGAASFHVAPPVGSAATAPEITSKSSGDWGAAATWSCGCVPSSTHAVKILAGHTVTVSGTRTAAKATVEGVLKASRTAVSSLTLSGNLIVRGTGVLDYGTSTSPIPASVTARIRWSLVESKYVGGVTDMPLETDVGLWIIDKGKISTNGPDRGAWTLLTSTAAAGTKLIVVDARYAWGWRVGDEVVVGPSNARTAGAPATYQDERRTIAAVSGGTVTLNSALNYEHKVQDVAWTDTFGHSYTERLAPPVANLTRNIVFEAANATHRPHTLIMDEATADIADAAFVFFGPAPKNIGKFSNGQFKPFSRYALHFHHQKDASRTSRLDGVLITGGAGRGLTVHDSYGITAYDVVVYDQAHTAFVGGNQAFWLEEAVSSTGEAVALTGANDLWMDRPLAMKFGAATTYRATGIHFGAGKGAQIFGAHAAESIGGLGAGMFWPTSTPCRDAECQNDPNRGVRGFRLTAHSSSFAFAWWNNAGVADDVVDLLGWNSQQGIDFGAYSTATELFHVRLIGNTSAQDVHRVVGYKLTGFLLDGQNNGGAGIRVDTHTVLSTQDEVYENGVIRGVNTAMAFACEAGQSGCGQEPHVQLARVRFEGDPLLSFVWHSDSGARWRIREQQGLLRPTNFTLYRKDQQIPGGVYDAAYEATRVNNDASGTVLPPPRVRMLQGSGCVADEAVVPTGTVTLCAETDAPTVEFYTGKDLIAKVGAAGTAQVSVSMTTFPKKRGYFYAKAIAANGRVNYSRVLRVIREVPSTAPALVQAPAQQPAAAPSTPTAVAAHPTPKAAPAPSPTPRLAAAPPTAAAAPPTPKAVTAAPTPKAAAAPSPTPRLAAATSSRGSVSSVTRARLYVVQVALVASRTEAAGMSSALKRAGFTPYVVRLGDRFAVRLGAFRQQTLAMRLAQSAAKKGFSTTIVGSP